MNSTIQKILVPVTCDAHFASTVRFAVEIANQCCAAITFLAVEDDSLEFETVRLPFHKREFVHHPIDPDALQCSETRSNLGTACSEAANQGAISEVVSVKGHSASEVLFLSRFHDLVILSDQTQFKSRDDAERRPINPLLEILDQCVVPVILSGHSAGRKIDEIVIYFDGSASSTRALHSAANLFQPWPETQFHVRTFSVNQSVAQLLADRAVGFLESRGYQNIIAQHNYRESLQAAFSTDKDRSVQLVALGVNNHQSNQPEMGFLAEHFLYDEPTKHKLFL